VAEYLKAYERRGGKAVYETQRAAETHILPGLATAPVGKLTARKIADWHQGLAEKRARVRTKPGRRQNYRETVTGPDGVRKRRAQIGIIWSASRFGSWDHERRVRDPYFANEPSCEPRMSFGEAAQHYGMIKLRERFPDVSETALKEMLLWPLNLLQRTLEELMRPGPPHSSDAIPPKEALRRVKPELDSLFASAASNEISRAN
jgi:hypothetical protein